MEALNFCYVQQFLLDHSSEGIEGREDAARGAAHVKSASGVACAFTTMLAVVHLITLVAAFSIPVTSLALVATAAIALVFREIFIISGNVVDTLSNDGPLANITGRGTAALTPQLFVNSIFANTWIAGPIFGASIVKEFEYSIRESSPART